MLFRHLVAVDLFFCEGDHDNHGQPDEQQDKGNWEEPVR
jgi:hypothetical protein